MCKIRISPQFWASDEHKVTRGLRGPCAKFAFHHSFGSSTSTKWREGCEGHVQNSHFTTVLGVRRAQSDQRVVSRRCQPSPPGVKRRKKFLKKSWCTAILSSHSQQLYSAAIPSSHSQQPLLSSSSQQPFSPATSHHVAVVRGWWSAIVTACFGGELLSHHVAVVKGWWSAIVTSCCCGQGCVVSYCHIMFCCGQELMVSYCHIMLLWSGVGGQLLSHHVAVVKSWWSAILTSCCCGQGLVVSYCHIMLLWPRVGGRLFSHHVGVVRGWWSAIVTSCCCGQGLVVHVGGQLRTRSLEEPFRGAFGKKINMMKTLDALGFIWFYRGPTPTGCTQRGFLNTSFFCAWLRRWHQAVAVCLQF